MKPLNLVSQHLFWFCIGIALLLGLLTYVLFEHVSHYKEVSGELLVNPTFDNGLAGWRSSRYVNRNQQETIDLSNRNPLEVQSIWQVIPVPETRALKLTAVYSIRNVTQGMESWHNARLGVGGRIQEEKWRWDFKGTVFEGIGTKSLDKSSAVVLVPEDLNELRVEFELGGGTGEFRVHEIQSVMVEPLFHIELLVVGLKFCWGALGVLILFVSVTRGLWITVPASALMLFLLLFIPKSQKENLLLWSSELWAALVPTVWQIDFDHLLLFTAFSTFVIIYLKSLESPIAVHRVFISLVTVAISLEVLQYFTQFRSVNAGDAGVNIVGAVLPLGISHLITYLRKSGPETTGTSR